MLAINVPSFEELRVVKATTIGNGGTFFMEIHNEPGVLRQVHLVERPEGPMKGWSHFDKFIVRDDDGKEFIFKRHKFGGPVFLVTEATDNNTKKIKNFRVTFYTIKDVNIDDPNYVMPKRAAMNAANRKKKV